MAPNLRLNPIEAPCALEDPHLSRATGRKSAAGMKQFRELDDPCRRVLIQALVAGIFSSAGGAAAQNIVDPALQELPAGQSFYHVSGRVLVNDRLATLQTPIRSGDIVETASNAEAIFFVGSDAFILRGEGRMVVTAQPASSALKTALRVVTSAALSLFGGGKAPRANTATIGIRN